jgi:uncharacterized membrane protein YkoI
MTLLLLIALLVGGLFVGAMIFNGSSVMAQTADDDGEETEADGEEDSVEGPDTPITGSALEQASAAALEYIGEGRVTATEVGDEEGYYEVEITLDNGRQVDVHLDENFNVLGREDE